MDRKSFLARLIAVPAALLGMKVLADVPEPDWRDLQSIGEYKELTLEQLRSRVPRLSSEETRLLKQAQHDLIMHGEASFPSPIRWEANGRKIETFLGMDRLNLSFFDGGKFQSLTTGGKTYHFYKDQLIAVE
jgi:hypothetical protein